MKIRNIIIEAVLANVLFWLGTINLIFLVSRGQEGLNAGWEWSFICSAPNVGFCIVVCIIGIVLGLHGVYAAIFPKEESK